MDLLLSQKLKFAPKDYLLRAGYHEFNDPNTGKISYIRRLGGEFYPRLHIYIEEKSAGIFLSLHLDQKKPSYGGGTHAHGGEYDGPLIERELDRLRGFIVGMDGDDEGGQVTPQEEKRGFFGRLFR